jgi:7,8-dihydropterin-6-yl-methyl-4-(beta-D-ribofuranosyl)aminobenzene 5'-phosphate synthase
MSELPKRDYSEEKSSAARFGASGGYRYTLPLRREQKAASICWISPIPDVLNNNIELLEIDLQEVDGMILSHGHLDHWGGLAGVPAKVSSLDAFGPAALSRW